MQVQSLQDVQPDQIILAFPNCTHASWALTLLREKNPDMEIYRDGDHVFLVEKKDDGSNLPNLQPPVE